MKITNRRYVICLLLTLLLVLFSACTSTAVKGKPVDSMVNSNYSESSPSSLPSSVAENDNASSNTEGSLVKRLNDVIESSTASFKLTDVTTQDFSSFSDDEQHMMESFLNTTSNTIPDKVGLVYLDITNTTESELTFNLNIDIGCQIDPMLQYPGVVHPIYLNSNISHSDGEDFTKYFDITLESKETISVALGYPLSDDVINVPVYFYPNNLIMQGLPADITEEELQKLINEQVCYLVQFNGEEE